MSDRSGARVRAATVAAAPVVLLAALVAHPHIPGTLPNDEAIASAVLADPTRWALAHLAAAVASGVLALAFLAVHELLREVGESRWSGRGVPLVVVGSVLYAVLPGMEFAPLAASEAGGDVVATQAALGAWFLPVLGTAALTFALGTGAFVVALTRSGILAPAFRWIVAGALLVMAGSRFVPLAVVQFEVQGVAALVAFWPLAHAMWGMHRPSDFKATPEAARTPSGRPHEPNALTGRNP